MLDKKHQEILLRYEQTGMIPRVIAQERHVDDSGREGKVILLGDVYGFDAWFEPDKIKKIIPPRPASRTTVYNWKKQDVHK